MPKSAADNFKLDDQIGHLLRLAYQSASGHFARRLRPYDLKPQQFATLLRLRELGATSQNRLGEAVGMPRANIHKMVERLAARGLITATPDPDDARRRRVELTASGRRLVARLIPLDEASTEDALAALSAGERQTLYRLLRRML
jgi:MarR family transcriptional regulator, lower aerobic nicotinate degradation pathway regulator